MNLLLEARELFKEIPHTQKGSNPGAIHVDDAGNKHYIKFYRDPEQAKAEVASANIMKLIGANTLNPKIVKVGGKVGVATPWQDNLHQDPDTLTTTDLQGHHQQLARIYHGAVLTKNWDVAGDALDNILISRNRTMRNVISADQGGSFTFRAIGGKKPYDTDVSELKNFKSSQYMSGHVFGRLNREAERDSLQAVRNLKHQDVHQAFISAGYSHGEATTLAKTLMARQQGIIKHYEKSN